MRLLPLRERSLLRLIYQRGATQAELAGAIGMSQRSIRRTIRNALERLADPLLLDIVACWHRLSPSQQRLIYLHRVLGMSLSKIARDGLMPQELRDGRTAERPCLCTLRKQWREIERKVRRQGGQVAADQPPESPDPLAPDSPASTG
jgi:transcriptional regulator with XRE-family HTH domain